MAGRSELILALEQIEREKGIKKDEILKMIEGAVISSLRKHVGKNTVIEAAIDPDTAEFRANVIKKAVETVADPELEISLTEARRYKRDAAAGEDVRLPAPAADFARIAAQTAKQVLTQKIREVERDSLYEEFKPKEGEIVNGSVHRFLDRNIVVELGKTEAVLPLREQIRRERYSVGSPVRAVILRVERALRGPQVVLSRAAPIFLRRLLELEVPEVAEKIIEIIEIVRDPGFRAKVIVKSNDPKVDPVGSCVGIRGSRIRSIMNELAGERVDLIPYSPESQTLIANALAPAKVSSVKIFDSGKRLAEATVADEQLSVAIGKDGQNIRLAERLTGWTFEVKSESQKESENKARKQQIGEELAALGLGAKAVGILIKAGMTDVARLARTNPSDLTALQGIGEKSAAKIVASAREHLEKQGAAAPQRAPE